MYALPPVEVLKKTGTESWASTPRPPIRRIGRRWRASHRRQDLADVGLERKIARVREVQEFIERNSCARPVGIRGGVTDGSQIPGP
jgi:hypothetical protein